MTRQLVTFISIAEIVQECVDIRDVMLIEFVASIILATYLLFPQFIPQVVIISFDLVNISTQGTEVHLLQAQAQLLT